MGTNEKSFLKAGVANTIYTWTLPAEDIKNINRESKIKSKIFSMVDRPYIEWCLVMTQSSYHPYHISLHLENCRADKKTVSLNVYFSIVDKKNDPAFVRKVHISDLIDVNAKYGFDNFISPTEMNDQSSENQRIRIRCKIKNITDGDLRELPRKEFEYFVNNETFSDVVFLVGEKKIPAHKMMLTSHSQVFRKMFSTDMIESNSNEVKVPNNIEFEVFFSLLRFMYTGEVENLDKLSLKIFKASHYYQIDNLQIISEWHLRNTLSIENAIYLLKLSDQCSADCLTKHCIAYIMNNFEAIVNTDAFKDLFKTDPHLPLKLLTTMGSLFLK